MQFEIHEHPHGPAQVEVQLGADGCPCRRWSCWRSRARRRPWPSACGAPVPWRPAARPPACRSPGSGCRSSAAMKRFTTLPWGSSRYRPWLKNTAPGEVQLLPVSTPLYLPSLMLLLSPVVKRPSRMIWSSSRGRSGGPSAGWPPARRCRRVRVSVRRLAEVVHGEAAEAGVALAQQRVLVELGAGPEDVGGVVLVAEVEVEHAVVVAQAGVQPLAEDRDAALAVARVRHVAEERPTEVSMERSCSPRPYRVTSSSCSTLFS